MLKEPQATDVRIHYKKAKENISPAQMTKIAGMAAE